MALKCLRLSSKFTSIVNFYNTNQRAPLASFDAKMGSPSQSPTAVALFRYVWLTALPDDIHRVLSADDSGLEELAVKATRMLKEAVVKKKRIEQVNAVRFSSWEDLGEIDAVSSGPSKAKLGIVCANHLRFP